uniref:Uncharacterized protein n=1 Tax=Acrobeloides nanus TaxID=290746 RepID=A0A914C3Q0_9BILA
MERYVVGPHRYTGENNPSYVKAESVDIERSFRPSPEPFYKSPIYVTPPPPPDSNGGGRSWGWIICGGLFCMLIFFIFAVVLAFFVFNRGIDGPGIYRTSRVIEGFSIG